MFSPIILLTALVLPYHTCNARPSQDSAAAPATAQLTEDQIGLTLFRPIHSNARDLINYAKDLTESSVQFVVKSVGAGRGELRRRDRFVQIESSIGVQDDEAGRKRAIDFLTELDAFIGQNHKEPVAEATSLVRTVRLRSMGVGSAMQLLDALAGKVEKQVVAETGTIVLRGATEDVARAESLLIEVDKPAPQMMLHVTLVELVDGVPEHPIGGQLGDALMKLMPGKQPERAGAFMLRASVAGNAPIELLSTFGGNVEVPARFTLVARSRSWDAERKVLTLGGCEVRSERPRFAPVVTIAAQAATGAGQPVAQQPAPQEVVAGIDKEGFSTDLTLNLGQDTVVGSLGGNALLVVLRFTVD